MGDEGDFWRDVKAAKRLAKQAVADWNDKYSVGTVVVVTKDRGEQVYTKTRSIAQLGGGGAVAVIFLEGISGYYDLSRVMPCLPQKDEGTT